ncbi:hypothetical protein Lal_00031945 [Lupinus albus]|uniref:Uncharacterized protein n=1 Tax=Lupinus albus TaxID=3870 RepID=A0A6A5P5J4_LUPAL|nr:hypothetical protein Lalb_Chr11g0072181 [Lupinus albus]KAF1892673.1 hypothetical protein Lal_00031945 [Lupinus albus]
MDTDQITVQPPQHRGAGGKLRRPPPRKPPASPYARPPDTTRRRWISKLVDPAYRLIAGGATRILPSFFSTPAPAPALPVTSSDTQDDQGKWQSGEQGHGDDGHKSYSHLQASKSTEIESAGHISGELKTSSVIDLHRQDEKGEQSDKNTISDIVKLVEGNIFSRDEFSRLVEVLNSRAIDLPNVEKGKENNNLASRKDHQELALAHRLPKVSNERRHEELNGAIWGNSTPLGLSKVQDEIGASPIDIARAYMDSRASEAGPSSKSIIQTIESTVLHGAEAAIKPYDPSPYKSSSCWPGAIVQDAYVTPHGQRSRYGLQNFPRTPYSRSLLSKSKTRLTHMQGDSHISSTPLRQSEATRYLQDKSKADASESGYGSVGPIRRNRHTVGAQSSSRRPAYSSLRGPSQSGVNEGFNPVTRSSDPDGRSSTRKPLGFEVGTPTVPMHTSLMAKKILEHIDRNIPTPKEKSAELKLATEWKNTEPTILSKDVSPYKYDGLDGKKSVLANEGQGNFHFGIPLKEIADKSINVTKEGTSASNMNIHRSIPRLGNDAMTTQNFGGSQFSLTKSTEHQDVLKTLPSGGNPFELNLEKKPISNSPASKPLLPPISIKKHDPKWTLSSDNGSGFTFPISASSSVLSEPPTPSIMPLFSTGDQHQSNERSTEPSYSFGLKNSSQALVFSFPSTSNTPVHNDAGEIKFNFGSNNKERLSFSFGKDAVCY